LPRRRSSSMKDFNIYIYIYRCWMVIVQLLPSLFLFSLGAVVRSFVCSFFRRRLFDQGGVQEWEEKIYKHTYTYTQYACSRVECRPKEKKSRYVLANLRTDRQIRRTNRASSEQEKRITRRIRERRVSGTGVARTRGRSIFIY
jgi:hypothetical protein